jgi:chemotaxis signal transduction protein
MTAPDGLTIAGETFRLPPGGRPVAAPTPVRPVPGAPPGLLGLTVQDGHLLPVWSPEPTPAAWVRLEAGLVGGSGFGRVPADAPLLALPTMPLAPPVAPLPAPPPAQAGATPPKTSAQAVLRLGDAALHLPLQALAGIRPWPRNISPVPGQPLGTAGYADTVDGPVLLLDAGWCFGASAPQRAGEEFHVAVLRHAGRQLGIPCRAVAPGDAGPAFLPRLETQAGRRLLALAPHPRPAPPVADAQQQSRRSLLLCRAGGVAFFLPAEAVEAVMPPQRPLPIPWGGQPSGWIGACAHRGAVLPVADAARALGALTLPEAPPLLRLAGGLPVALAVAEILGLRTILEDAITPLEDDPMVAALVASEGGLLPLCRARALVGAPTSSPAAGA